MKKYHSDNFIKKQYIKIKLKKNGLEVNKDGIISYNTKKLTLNAKAIYLLRHAETQATQNHEFMSDVSKNSHVCKKGIEDMLELVKEVEKYKFDEVIICSDIPRVLETGNIFKLLNPNYQYKYLKNIKGIDNNGWEGETHQTLKGIDLEDYKQREEKHNIFAKSAKGGSWGQVLLNTIKLIKYLNKNCKNKRILLISQGSILTGLKILTHIPEKPWGDYNTKKLYNLNKEQTKSNYAKINCLYDNEKETKNG